MKSEEGEANYHFLFRCKAVRPDVDLFSLKLFSHVETKATAEADVITTYIGNLNDNSKILLLTAGPAKATLPALYE